MESMIISLAIAWSPSYGQHHFTLITGTTTTTPVDQDPLCKAFYDPSEQMLRPVDVCMQLNSTTSVLFQCNSDGDVVAYTFDSTDCSGFDTDYRSTAGSVYCDSGVTCDVGKLEVYDFNTTCDDTPDSIDYVILYNCVKDPNPNYNAYGQHECADDGTVAYYLYTKNDCTGDKSIVLKGISAQSCVDDGVGTTVGACTPKTTNPTTDPTNDPTNNPTTLSPTSDPTMEPTEMPTELPTADLTISTTSALTYDWDPQCNAYFDSWTYSMLPADVCMRMNGTHHYILKCNSDGNVDAFVYTTTDCSGSLTSHLTDYGTSADGTVYCDSGVTCDVGKVEYYNNISACDEGPDYTYYPILYNCDVDYEFQYECNADGKLVVNYYNVSDCSDDPYYELNFTRATCVDDGSERMVGTCTPKTVTTMPTEIPTELPTVDPTTDPTTEPTKGCTSHDDCDELYYCNGNRQCDWCSECHFCDDGVDGTCGSCGDGYPTMEAGPCKLNPSCNSWYEHDSLQPTGVCLPNTLGLSAATEKSTMYICNSTTGTITQANYDGLDCDPSNLVFADVNYCETSDCTAVFCDSGKQCDHARIDSYPVYYNQEDVTVCPEEKQAAGDLARAVVLDFCNIMEFTRDTYYSCDMNGTLSISYFSSGTNCAGSPLSVENYAKQCNESVGICPNVDNDGTLPPETTSSPYYYGNGDSDPSCNSFFNTDEEVLFPTDVCMENNATTSYMFECNLDGNIDAFLYGTTDCLGMYIQSVSDYVPSMVNGSVYCDSNVTCDVAKLDLYNGTSCADGPVENHYLILNYCTPWGIEYGCDSQGQVTISACYSGFLFNTTVAAANDCVEGINETVGTCTPTTTMAPFTTTDVTGSTDDTESTDDTIVDETGTTTVPIPVPTPSPTSADINTGSVMRMSVVLPAIVGVFGYIFFF